MLSDCFIGLLAYVTFFIRSVGGDNQPSFERVREDILRHLSLSEDGVRRGIVSQEDYDQARFAVCAWVDEALLASPWNVRDQWLREQLQHTYYNTTEAGKKFFERLQSLGAHQRDIREIYYLCLALGFTGQYFNAEHTLAQVKTSNLKLLMGSSLGLPSLEREELFPEAYPTEGSETGPRKDNIRDRMFIAVCIAAPVALFGILFTIYRFTLSGVGQNFLRMVSNP
jgi:type VI secretion system protein ImpK